MKRHPHTEAYLAVRSADVRILTQEEAVVLLAEPYRRACAAVNVACDGVPLDNPWEALFFNGVLAAAVAGRFDDARRYYVSNFVAAPGRLGVIGARTLLAWLRRGVDEGRIHDVVGTIHRDNLPMMRAVLTAFGAQQPRPLGYVMSYRER